ncbi:MAG TPA: hypothetical protein VJ385_22595 [Fibrobacteria bacterium]|nr:hypothetical protein [Fibrobacteria bacterium]
MHGLKGARLFAVPWEGIKAAEPAAHQSQAWLLPSSTPGCGLTGWFPAGLGAFPAGAARAESWMGGGKYILVGSIWGERRSSALKWLSALTWEAESAAHMTSRYR